MTLILLVSLFAYLLGSIPFGLILSKKILYIDIRKLGSKNIGATNVIRAGNRKIGALTLLLDISKVIIILPNKRSRIFLKQEISRIVKKTIFSPIIYDIESFMSIVSGLDKISDTELLFEFYNIYLNQTKKEEQQSFEEFISWA